MPEVEVLEPQTKVQIAGVNMLVEEYKWRDKKGEFHRIDDMETRHIFHVVRMVWDHSMPPGHQTSFPNRYRFPEFYSEPYMALTVRLMLPVLFHRRDLQPYMEYWLQFMHDRLMGNPPQIPFVRMIGYKDAK